ncbi:hypothetical protein CYLTODRAFT_415112 [Cylindrobasidium torrendii FP15055 ss-10]|uniref:Uncharacterized protein n=1 Tax=Cylindrobasidium torrendii FP15055 ss-10 TaxID=1314674 RepID=A0A0D7AVM7_9AGAR|nr:hypothetical protein CYLTODRAFT_415112 [Cylindrobasidium torrendii FP15055 ss-10]
MGGGLGEGQRRARRGGALATPLRPLDARLYGMQSRRMVVNVWKAICSVDVYGMLSAVEKEWIRDLVKFWVRVGPMGAVMLWKAWLSREKNRLFDGRAKAFGPRRAMSSGLGVLESSAIPAGAGYVVLHGLCPYPDTVIQRYHPNQIRWVIGPTVLNIFSAWLTQAQSALWTWVEKTDPILESSSCKLFGPLDRLLPQFIRLEPELGQFICVICQDALPPVPHGAGTIWKKHFRHHLDPFKRPKRSAAIKLLCSYPGTKPEASLPEIPDGRIAREPFEGLRKSEGFGCGHCPYAAEDKKTLAQHVKTAHQDLCPGAPSCPKKCGTRKADFQKISKNICFQVAVQENSHVQTMLEYIQDREHSTLVEILHKPGDARKISPYLLCTQWMDLVDGKAPIYLLQQRTLAGLPDDDWRFLVEAIQRYYNCCLDCIRNIPDNILKRLRPTENFQPIQEGKPSYINTLKHFLTCLLWQPPADSLPTDYVHIPKDADLQTAVDDIMDCVASKGSSADFNKALDSFFTALWHRPSKATQSKPFADPTLCALGLMHLNKDGAFDQSPTQLTRVVYFMRLFVARRIGQLLSSAEDLLGWLSCDTNTTFRFVWAIYTFKQNPMGYPRTWPVQLNPIQSLRYDGHKFDLGTLRNFIQALHQEWVRRWKDSVLLDTGDRFVLPLNLRGGLPMKDTLSTSMDGESLFSLNPSPSLDEFRIHLVNKITSPADWRVWFQSLARLEGMVLILCMLEHSPGRAFDLHNLRVANSYDGALPGPRAVFHYQGNFILVRHSNGKNQHVPQGLSGFVSWALLQIHCLARPIAEEKIPVLHPDGSFTELARDFRIRLFMAANGPWTTAMVSKILTERTPSAFGWTVKVESLRQILITLHRYSVPEADLLMEDDLFQVVAALQAAHSKERQDNSYAVIKDTVTPGMDWGKIERYLELSRAWQRSLLVAVSGAQMINGLDT